MRTENLIILASGDMSQATLTSSSVPCVWMEDCCVQSVYTGAPNGSLKLQVTCDGTNWTDLSSPAAVSIAAAGSCIFQLSNIGYTGLRAVYTKSSGTGSLTIVANAKG